MSGLQGIGGFPLSSKKQARHGERRKVVQPPMPTFSAAEKPKSARVATAGKANGASGALFRVPGGAPVGAKYSHAAAQDAEQAFVEQESYDDDDDEEFEYDGDEEQEAASGSVSALLGEVTKASPMQILAQQISDSANYEVERRIVRVDGGVLDQPRHAERLREVMQCAREIVRRLGVKNVIELVVHAHTKLVYNRHGRRVLDGYVLSCYGNTPAQFFSELDFGHHSVVLQLRPDSMNSGATADSARLRAVADTLLEAAVGDRYACNGQPAVFYDEGLLPPMLVQKPLPIPRAGVELATNDGGANLVFTTAPPRDPNATATDDDQSNAPPTLAYNGEVMLMQGFAQGVGTTHQLLVQNHCTKAVQILHERVHALQLNINELYRSMAYDACMTHSVRSCIKVAFAAAKAMGAEVATFGEVRTDPLGNVHIEACAPLTFISAVPQCDSANRAIAPSFIVHVNTYGEYELARPMQPTPPPPIHSAGRSKAPLHEGITHDWRAYPLLDSGTGGCTIMRQIEPRLAPAQPYWLNVRSDQCAKAARETRESLRPIPMGILNHRTLDITGYPTRGVFDSEAERRDPTNLSQPVQLASGGTRACHVVFRCYQQPHQNSKHYAPLVPASRSGVMFELWSKGYPQALGTDRRFTASNTSDVLIKYSGGLNGASITLDLALYVQSPVDHLRVPPINRAMYMEVMQVALRFYGHCITITRTAEEVLRSNVRSKSALLRDGVGRQAFLDVLAGGAVQCDPHDQVTLLVDTQWLMYCLNTLHLFEIAAR